MMLEPNATGDFPKIAPAVDDGSSLRAGRATPGTHTTGRTRLRQKGLSD
jgi:hypothetical protein